MKRNYYSNQMLREVKKIEDTINKRSEMFDQFDDYMKELSIFSKELENANNKKTNDSNNDEIDRQTNNISYTDDYFDKLSNNTDDYFDKLSNNTVLNSY